MFITISIFLEGKMRFILLFISIILLHTARCQRRIPWRGGRVPARRLPPCIEDRLRSIAPNVPSHRAPELPVLPNRAIEVPVVPSRAREVPTPPCKLEAPSALEAAAQLAQNIPKPDVNTPAADYYQNVLLSPNLYGVVLNQIVPNQIATNQRIPTEVPRSYQIPMQNVQYLQNLLITKPQGILEVPRSEKIFVQTIEPENPCPCNTPPPSPNQFLPAASPLSPWMASRLPSPPNQARSHLRKIPIPPPTL